MTASPIKLGECRPEHQLTEPQWHFERMVLARFPCRGLLIGKRTVAERRDALHGFLLEQGVFDQIAGTRRGMPATWRELYEVVYEPPDVQTSAGEVA